MNQCQQAIREIKHRAVSDLYVHQMTGFKAYSLQLVNTGDMDTGTQAGSPWRLHSTGTRLCTCVRYGVHTIPYFPARCAALQKNKLSRPTPIEQQEILYL